MSRDSCAAEIDVRVPRASGRAYLERRGLWEEDAETSTANDALSRIDAVVQEAEGRPLPTLDAYVEVAR